jgi:outer membrane biogenesis lipoprotein LolB
MSMDRSTVRRLLHVTASSAIALLMATAMTAQTPPPQDRAAAFRESIAQNQSELSARRSP